MQSVSGRMRVLRISLVVLAFLPVFPGFAGDQEAKESINETCHQVVSSLGHLEGHAKEAELTSKYQGKWVKWTGSVTRINETLWGVELGIKCQPDSTVDAVTLSLEGSWKPRIKQFSMGQVVQFAGQIDGYCELGGITVSNGELVEAKTSAYSPRPQPQPELSPSRQAIQSPRPSASADQSAPSPSSPSVTATNGLISSAINKFYLSVAQKRVGDALDLFALERRPNIKRNVLESVAKDTEYYRIERIDVSLTGNSSAKAFVRLYHKKYQKPEEKWEIDISMVKENGEWKIWSTPGKRVN